MPFLVHTGTVLSCKPERPSETSCYILPVRGNNRETAPLQDTSPRWPFHTGRRNLTPIKETGALTMKMYASRTVRRSVVAALAAATLGPLAVLAAQDFPRYSHEELVQRRSQAQDMNETDRLRYREEMKTRTQNM